MSSWIETHIRRAIDQTADGHGDWCVTIESNDDESKWVQFTSEYVNFAYPSAEDPQAVLRSLPTVPQCELSAFESSLYLTVSHAADESLPELAEFVAAYVRDVLGVEPDSSNWSVWEESL